MGEQQVVTSLSIQFLQKALQCMFECKTFIIRIVFCTVIKFNQCEVF